ncbi:MAG: hypothetical protein NVS4B10_09670 [Myxococcales bacterium]
MARKHGWGGKRTGAGRPRTDRAKAPPGVPHLRRPKLNPAHPVAVTLKVRREVWNLRQGRSVRLLRRALAESRAREDFRLVHFAILNNHLHLIAEASDQPALSRGVQALEIRLARQLNLAMGRSGQVFADRFHAHVLRTPREVANARSYVLDNLDLHRRRAGLPPRADPDPLTSARMSACAMPPETWLLRAGWRGHHAGRGAAEAQRALFRDFV